MTGWDITRIHAAVLEIMSTVGVRFYSRQAVDIFKHHGLKTDDNLVFFQSRHVRQALDSIPADFTLYARNPEKSIHIGSGETALAPGYGAPHIMTEEGKKKSATLEDYHDFCKLVHTSDVINVSGFLIVDPHELPRSTYHRDMLHSHMTLCDMPFMGSPLSGAAMQDAINMARILFGLAQKGNQPFQAVMISNISSLAPLQYAEEMADALIVSARYHQPVIIMGAGIMGATSPMKLAGHLAVQTACVLAGLVLTQLVAPGTPVILGGGGSQLDMQTGSFYNGSPETLATVSATRALANYYNLPCRTGGGLNDAHSLDFQAGAQAAMSLFCTLREGVDFILHACGILAAFMAMSATKFIADEDLIRTLQMLAEPVDTSDEAIDLDVIRQVGPSGEYLTHPQTLALCRNGFMPTRVMNRLPLDAWQAAGAPDIHKKAAGVFQKRLRSYLKPDIDPSIERDLKRYIQS